MCPTFKSCFLILGVNTLIQVYKPGTYKDDWSGFSVNPVVLISMNGTGMIDLNEFDILKKMTTVAIQILNKEKEGIIPYVFCLFYIFSCCI